MGPTISQRHILLIDSDPLARQTLAEVLEGAGHRVSARDQAGVLGGVDLIVADPVILATLANCGVPMLVLAKPVRLAPLLARIEDTLANPASFAGPVILGPWRFDRTARLLEDDAGRRVRLTDKEAAILTRLHQAGGVVAR